MDPLPLTGPIRRRILRSVRGEVVTYLQVAARQALDKGEERREVELLLDRIDGDYELAMRAAKPGGRQELIAFLKLVVEVLTLVIGVLSLAAAVEDGR